MADDLEFDGPPQGVRCNHGFNPFSCPTCRGTRALYCPHVTCDIAWFDGKPVWKRSIKHGTVAYICGHCSFRMSDGRLSIGES